MAQPSQALPPHWLDKVIEREINSQDPRQIAQAIADSTELLDAIREGLKNKPPPGLAAPTWAQEVRRKVVDRINDPNP
jgi:hypothetical protein